MDKIDRFVQRFVLVMRVQLSDHFTYKKLIQFTIPSVLMLVFTSIYSIVDGVFVSNYAGKTAFAALNLIFPVLMIVMTLGYMIGSGGAVLVAKTLGEGRKKEANEMFSFFVYFTMALSSLAAIIIYRFIPEISLLLGAEGDMLEYSIVYARTMLLGTPFWMVNIEFQYFFATAEKPQLGFWMSVMAGITNIVGDFVLVGLMHMGIKGAAIASISAQFVGGVYPLIYFLLPNTSLLQLGKAKCSYKDFIKMCTNGASELLANASMSLVAVLYNFQLMKYIGEDGVSAYGVLMYLSMIFTSIFFGYGTGTSSIVSFNLGQKNIKEISSILKKSLVIITVVSVVMFILGEVSAQPIGSIFAGYDEDLKSLTVHAFTIYSISFLFCGFSIMGSSFFTGLNNGLMSGLISFIKLFVFNILCVMLLPLVMGVEGVWWAIVLVEVLADIVTGVILVYNQNRYGY